MKILALEPYYGGSHKAFLDGWIKHSRHQWTLLTLPATKWKYRMRHAAINFAHTINQDSSSAKEYNLVVCSDMLNLAEFKGLVEKPIQSLPSVVYFHENQLTYPVRHHKERDYHFPFTNLTTALAATEIWFNSNFHQNSFLKALPKFLKRLPDHQPLDVLDSLPQKCSVAHPGIDSIPPRSGTRSNSPLHILWVARWEHDKNPEDFFAALEKLKESGTDFRLSVLGESFEEAPEIFESSSVSLADHILHWGYQESRGKYIEILSEADVVVSTANHEFFGLAIVESIAAGAFPLLPKRLSYPEILNLENSLLIEECFFDGAIGSLVSKLQMLAQRTKAGNFLTEHQAILRDLAQRHFWVNRASDFDSRLDEIIAVKR